MIKFIKSLFYSETKKKILKLRVSEVGSKEYRLQTNGEIPEYLCCKIDCFTILWHDLQKGLNYYVFTLVGLATRYNPSMKDSEVEGRVSEIRREMRILCLEKKHMTMADFLDIFIKHMEK